MLFSPAFHRASKSKRSALAVARAVAIVMQRELGGEALARWKDMLDVELGEPLFGKLNVLKRVPKPRPGPVPPPRPFADPEEQDGSAPVATRRCWVPAKPKLAALLLDVFGCGNERLPDGQPIALSVQAADGSDMFKMMAK